MSILIDEVYTEVSNPRRKTPREGRSQVESACLMDGDSEKMLCDQITRLATRQLRLSAD